MYKIIAEHNAELETEVGMAINSKLGDDWFDKIVGFQDGKNEVVYTLFDENEKDDFISVLKSFGLEVYLVEDCDEFISNLYSKNKFESFLSGFDKVFSTSFMNSFYQQINENHVLDKISTSGLESLNSEDYRVLSNI